MPWPFSSPTDPVWRRSEVECLWGKSVPCRSGNQRSHGYQEAGGDLWGAPGGVSACPFLTAVQDPLPRFSDAHVVITALAVASQPWSCPHPQATAAAEDRAGWRPQLQRMAQVLGPCPTMLDAMGLVPHSWLPLLRDTSCPLFLGPSFLQLPVAWAAPHCLAQHRQPMPMGRRDAPGRAFPGSLAGRTLLGPASVQQDGRWPGGWQHPCAPWGRGWWDPCTLWAKARGLSMGSAGAEATVMLLLCQLVSARSRRWGRRMKDQDAGESPLGPGTGSSR